MTENDDLAKCRAEVHALEEENSQLRESASTFAALAERLHDQLAVERRQNSTDRRGVPRDIPDRRQSPAESAR